MSSAAPDVTAALGFLEQRFPYPAKLGGLGAHRYVAQWARAHVPAGGLVLDLGAGACDKSAVLARLGFRICAHDDLQDPWHRRDGAADRIMAFAKEAGVDLQVSDFRDARFPDDAFDLVMINGVIEHLHASPRPLLETALRALKAGGLLLVTTPNAVGLRKRIAPLLGRSGYPPADQFFDAPEWRGHVREWTLPELRRVLEWMGCDDVDGETFHNFLHMRLSGAPAVVYRAVTALAPGSRDYLSAWGRKPQRWAIRRSA